MLQILRIFIKFLFFLFYIFQYTTILIFRKAIFNIKNGFSVVNKKTSLKYCHVSIMSYLSKRVNLALNMTHFNSYKFHRQYPTLYISVVSLFTTMCLCRLKIFTQFSNIYFYIHKDNTVLCLLFSNFVLN